MTKRADERYPLFANLERRAALHRDRLMTQVGITHTVITLWYHRNIVWSSFYGYSVINRLPFWYIVNAVANSTRAEPPCYFQTME